ncbi:MAG: hypothetical protein Q8M15_08860 [Bacteroidota bacterium]|nr:hypothetical protein [Bacteroidota bacterium]
MIWIIILIVGTILFRFFFSLNKDNDDFQTQTFPEKFNVIVQMINEVAFNSRGNIISLDKREFNLYENGQNQIIKFRYGTGHLTITWKYKYFQKEVIHEKTYNDVRNLSLFEQQKIGEQMINEMQMVIELHKRSVIEGI